MTSLPPFCRVFSMAVLMAGPLVATAQTNSIAINSTGAAPAVQAILDVSSTTSGMLIPRMTSAQRTALATADGLIVYQTDAPAGFYYYSATYAKWFRQSSFGNIWDLQGTDLMNSVYDFIGTTDNQPVVFRTNNVENMRFMGTTGYLGVGTTSAQEQLDVNGGLRIWAPTALLGGLGTVGTPGTNALYSQTANPGVITYQKDEFKSTTVSPDATATLLFRGHWGNVGTSAGAASPTTSGNGTTTAPTTGGWRRLENDYTEEFNKGYTQQGNLTCGAGSVEVSPGIAAATTTTDAIISPYAHTTTTRVRHQYMFRASELNAEAAQLAVPPTLTTAGGGLCPGQPITSIGFYVPAGAATMQKSWLTYSITVKHAAGGLNDLSGGFDESVDGAQACCVSTSAQTRPMSVAGGWDTFTLSSPFVWDGVHNVIIEVVFSSSGSTSVAPVKYAANVGFVATASRNSNSFLSPCSNVGAAGSCGAASSIIASGMPWGTGSCGTATTSNGRPVVQFNGTVSSITAPITSTGNYIRHAGGLIAEATTDPIPWGRWRTNFPLGTVEDSYQGPGTISAQKGIYDNGVRLNDHVFDRAFDGRVSAKDASTFGNQRNLSIQEMTEFTRMNHHLPTMRGRESWEQEGGFSLGDLTDQLWTTTETQALYVSDLHERLNVLEVLSDDRPLSRDEFTQARQAICSMPTLTETEKASLIDQLNGRVVEIGTQH